MRRRFDDLTAKVGTGGIDNAATTLPLNGALAYNGGATALPNIAAPDYVPITVSSAAASEKMWITAYTAGQSSATVARGKEGSSAIAHAAGDAIYHGPTVADLTGSAAAPSVRAFTHKSGVSATMSFDVPTTAVAGDLLIGYVATGQVPNGVPVGWTQLNPNNGIIQGQSYQQNDFFAKICAAGDPGTTVTCTANASYDFVGLCAAVSGVSKIKAAMRTSNGSGSVTALAGLPPLLNVEPSDFLLMLASYRASAGGTQTLSTDMVNASTLDTYSVTLNDLESTAIFTGNASRVLAAPILTASAAVKAMGYGVIALV